MKTNRLTLVLFIFCLNLVSSVTYSQSNTWQLLHEENGVQFYGMDTYCSNETDEKAHHFALLKIVNNNGQLVTLNFGFALEFEEGCSGCNEDSEFFIRLEIPAHSSLEGSCDDQSGKLTRIIRNMNLPGGWNYLATKIAFPIID